jgi:UPF0755 protein
MPQEALIRKIFKLYPWLILSLFFVFVFFHFVYSVYYPIFIGEKKIVNVDPGTKNWFLAQKLEKEGIIRSAFYFKILTSLKKSNLKAGIYEFSGFYNLNQIINILEKGGKGVRITITEGMTLKEIENLLRSKGFKVNLEKYKLADFENVDLKNYFDSNLGLEGFLAPDTYEFYPNESEKSIISRILKNFSKKFFPELLKNNELGLYETLILSSIIEKEAKFKEDFPVIAGILIKRLKNNKTLDVDATLVYEKCGYVFCDEELTKEDLKKDSPFNTYKRLGLPPQPISNPGLLAIKAINNPLETDYWFYLTDKTGKAIFAKTLKEHQQNISKYLK